MSNSFATKTPIAVAALAAFLMWIGVPGLAADKCQKRTAHADHELHEAIEHHGYNSSQAQHWRHELHEARDYCWNHDHRWWDEHEHRWRTDRDWADNDHEHR